MTTLYRWTCPICGESKVSIARSDENPRAKARASLQEHVRATDGNDHAPLGQYPDGFSPDVMDGEISVD